MLHVLFYTMKTPEVSLGLDRQSLGSQPTCFNTNVCCVRFDETDLSNKPKPLSLIYAEKGTSTCRVVSSGR